MRVPRIPEEGIRFHELELQEVVNSPRWALGTELGSSEGVMRALNHSLQPLTFSLAHFGEFQERPYENIGALFLYKTISGADFSAFQ